MTLMPGIPDRKESSLKTALAAFALTAVLLGVTASVGAASGTPLKIASTLDGKTVLPHRIQWLGMPTLPKSQIKRVEFLIDNKLVWIEHGAPYVYGSDHGSHRNYLVTSWLSAGTHKFAVRAVSTTDATAT